MLQGRADRLKERVPVGHEGLESGDGFGLIAHEAQQGREQAQADPLAAA